MLDYFLEGLAAHRNWQGYLLGFCVILTVALFASDYSRPKIARGGKSMWRRLLLPFRFIKAVAIESLRELKELLPKAGTPSTLSYRIELPDGHYNVLIDDSGERTIANWRGKPFGEAPLLPRGTSRFIVEGGTLRVLHVAGTSPSREEIAQYLDRKLCSV